MLTIRVRRNAVAKWSDSTRQVRAHKGTHTHTHTHVYKERERETLALRAALQRRHARIYPSFIRDAIVF